MSNLKRGTFGYNDRDGSPIMLSFYEIHVKEM